MTKENVDLLIALSSALMVVVTIGLIAIGWIQAVLMRRTAHRQLRAYVVVKEATIELRVRGVDELTREIVGRVVFMNAGQTPAYRLEHMRGLAITNRPDFENPGALSRYVSNTTILGPRVEHPDDLGYAADVTEQYHEIGAGTLTVYFWGQVNYQDIFGKEHRTRFAVNWPRIVTKLKDQGTIPCSREWNDAT